MLILVLVCTAAVTSVPAQDDVSPRPGDPVPDSVFVAENSASAMRWFPPRLYAGGCFYLPKASYSTENGIGLGGQLLRYYRLPGPPLNCPASLLRLNARVTMKGQALADLENDLYFGPRLFLRSRFSYSDLSYRFYGIGPSTPRSNEEVYRPQSTRAYTEMLRSVMSTLWVGVRIEVEQVGLLETEADGLLAQGDLRGTRRSTVVGTGLVGEWDRRPPGSRVGWNLQGFALWFDEELGSTHDFNNYNFDLRSYLDLGREHELAGQFFIYSTRGEPPFWRYAALGGRAHTRGYRRGRYLDRTLVAFQQELRFPIAWRIRGAAFAGLGDIAPRLTQMELDEMKPTIGGGLRFIMGEGNHAVARLDAALGGESPRFYFSFGEAF